MEVVTLDHLSMELVVLEAHHTCKHQLRVIVDQSLHHLEQVDQTSLQEKVTLVQSDQELKLLETYYKSLLIKVHLDMVVLVYHHQLLMTLQLEVKEVMDKAVIFRDNHL